MAEFSQSEWCLRNPLAETPPHPDAAKTQTLCIIDGIACKDGRGSQVVRCYLGDDKDHSYVAKIYDPLYYSYADRDWDSPTDVTYKAGEDYSREAAAFEDLKAAGADGHFAPKYYGSWTFDMPLPGAPLSGAPELRPVRLVLIEWVEGADLWSIMERDGANDGFHTVPPEKRLEIFAKAEEAKAKLTFYGVQHRDFAPRNIMLVDQESESGSPKVLLIDLNQSVCVNRPNFRDRDYWKTKPLPVSPRHILLGGPPLDFLQWLPQPHTSDVAVFNGWLEKRWPDPSSEYCMPPFWSGHERRMAKLVKYASPLPDTEPVFAGRYLRQYELPSLRYVPLAVEDCIVEIANGSVVPPTLMRRL
ncbi:hypothetical protein ACHAPT_012614 [Fusarium lateritium]